MDEKTPDYLRKYAENVARNTDKPYDRIFIRKEKQITETIEYKGGFLGLQKKTRQQVQTKIESEMYPLDCWILDTYTEDDIENDNYHSKYRWHYILRADGLLYVVVVNDHYCGNNRYSENSNIWIEEMTFLLPSLYSNNTQNIGGLLSGRSAYQLDVAHHNWTVDKGNGDRIERDHPYSLRNESSSNGAGQYQYSRGEGLYSKLHAIETYSSGIKRNRSSSTSTDVIPGRIYRIRSKSSALVLDAIGPDSGYGNGNNIGIWENNGKSNQRWMVLASSDGYIKLMCMSHVASARNPDGKVIDVDEGYNQNGTKIQMWDNQQGNHNQDIKLVKTSDESFIIKTRTSAESKCLDVYENRSELGTIVHQWEVNGGLNQKWVFEPVSNS